MAFCGEALNGAVRNGAERRRRRGVSGGSTIDPEEWTSEIQHELGGYKRGAIRESGQVLECCVVLRDGED